MVTDLKKLAELVRQDALPVWLKEQIESKKDEILKALQDKGVFILDGPYGERIEIKAEKEKTAAAA